MIISSEAKEEKLVLIFSDDDAKIFTRVCVIPWGRLPNRPQSQRSLQPNIEDEPTARGHEPEATCSSLLINAQNSKFEIIDRQQKKTIVSKPFSGGDGRLKNYQGRRQPMGTPTNSASKTEDVAAPH